MSDSIETADLVVVGAGKRSSTPHKRKKGISKEED